MGSVCAGRCAAKASDLALRWAKQQAAIRDLPIINVHGGGNPVNAGPIFRSAGPDRCHQNERAAGRGHVVMVTTPTFDAMRRAMMLAGDQALVAVDRPGPDRVTGWAAAIGALNLDDGTASTLDPGLRCFLDEILRLDADGFTEAWRHNSVHRLIAEMAADGLLERAVVQDCATSGVSGPTRRASRPR